MKLEFGPITIYYYSICILLGIIVAYEIIVKKAKKENLTEDDILNLFFVVLPISLLGARLYYCIFNFSYYKNNLMEIFEVWNGGLAIHGGIIVGLITLFIYTKKKKLNFLKILDILVVGLIIAQAIGRWGNFFNGEAHGPITTLENLKFLPKFIINGMYIDGNYYVPTFLYESIWCSLGFIIMNLLKNKKTGFITGFYFIWYGIGRFIIESYRTDSLMFLGFKIAQIVSLFMIIVGLILILKKEKA